MTKHNSWDENRDGRQIIRNRVNKGIGERLDRRKSLHAEGLEGIAGVTDWLLLRHGADAAGRRLCATIQRQQTGVRIERQEEIDRRQRDGDKRSAFHNRQVTTDRPCVQGTV